MLILCCRCRVSETTSALQTLSVGTKALWQFEGDSGAWHEYKCRVSYELVGGFIEMRCFILLF